MPTNTSALLLTTERGILFDQPCVEIEHDGYIAIVDGDGLLVSYCGDADKMVHLRSTAKPFQILPLIRRSPTRFDLADIAIMMASHSGEEIHTHRVAALLQNAGLDESCLLCGIHPPYDVESRKQAPSVLHNNCSGKHTAMLLMCQENGWRLENYTDANHPLQQEILTTLAGLCGCNLEQIGIGIDGCSLPTFILPVKYMAQLYACLAFSQNIAMKTIFQAGVENPYLIAGKNRIDTILMEALPGQLFAKSGADGVFAMAVAPSEKYPKGLGIAIKVSDGDASHHARTIIVTEILIQLGILCSDKNTWPAQLQKMASPNVRNCAGIHVATIKSHFKV